MEQSKPNLGLCFFKNQLYYAIDHPGREGALTRIGSVNFNFDVTEVLLSGNGEQFSGIRNTIQDIKDNFGINHIRSHSIPTQECWTTLPKIVYDKPDEREDHINILMHGVDRKNIEPTWYPLSNQDYKFLLLRNREAINGFNKMASDASTLDLVSDFELGERWGLHSDISGSYMMVCCFENCIAISSFILGKLRGATYLKFDVADDLPYLWLQSTGELNWMNGLHEQIFLYGYEAYRIAEILRPFWDDAAKVIRMDSLEKMQVETEEKTYSFNLELAFPAILLALEF